MNKHTVAISVAASTDMPITRQQAVVTMLPLLLSSFGLSFSGQSITMRGKVGPLNGTVTPVEDDPETNTDAGFMRAISNFAGMLSDDELPLYELIQYVGVAQSKEGTPPAVTLTALLERMEEEMKEHAADGEGGQDYE